MKTQDNKSLVHHSDRPSHGFQANRCRETGSQYLSIKYTERLAEAEIDLSVGTVGDAYGNALAESGRANEQNDQGGDCKIWTSKPDPFNLNPINQMPGLKNKG